MTKTKNRTFSVGWTVCSGPDASHLIEVRVFDRLRDALRAMDGAAPRPRQLWRHTWEHPYSTAGERRLVRDCSRGAA